MKTPKEPTGENTQTLRNAAAKDDTKKITKLLTKYSFDINQRQGALETSLMTGNLKAAQLLINDLEEEANLAPIYRRVLQTTLPPPKKAFKCNINTSSFISYVPTKYDLSQAPPPSDLQRRSILPTTPSKTIHGKPVATLARLKEVLTFLETQEKLTKEMQKNAARLLDRNGQFPAFQPSDGKIHNTFSNENTTSNTTTSTTSNSSKK